MLKKRSIISTYSRFPGKKLKDPYGYFLLCVLCPLFCVFSLYSCAARKTELPLYKGADAREIISQKNSISGAEVLFSIVFEHDDNSTRGDARLELTYDTLDLRVYSLGFLAAEVKEAGGIIKSNPRLDSNKSAMLVEGLRNSIFWWSLTDYEIREDNDSFTFSNPSRMLVLGKQTMLPEAQTMELPDGRQLKIYYDSPYRYGELWYPSKIRIELSKYVVLLNIKTLIFNPENAMPKIK